MNFVPIIFQSANDVANFGIPKLFIFGTVASGLVFGVVVGLTLIVCKHKKVSTNQYEY